MLLVFDPRLSEAWLRDLESDSRLVGITLCIEHANRVTVPSGWSLGDDRSRTQRVSGAGAKDHPATSESTEPTVRLASVTAITEPTEADSEADEATAADQTSPDSDIQPESAGDDSHDDVPEDTDADVDDGDPDDDGIIERPTLWDGDEPEGLRVDSSTPMLSRAFRAAHID